ncbi:hypothetical protein NOV72_02024 [Caballeronia novacaledonica]|uniref:Uncharacterized protein n=1 Tax=Caballeronia novacaledonica TaxID=1544861 RepID=A0A2U3I3R7_9BURK|nr:hypothetical protein [Caballeronia novacaledonica]SPB14792.1 hypothetical protein NOV72_02024 [Caballeronia novacaledonica]
MKFIEALWTFALRNPHLLYVPAIGFVLSLVVLRIEKRYVEAGVFFGRSSASSRVNRTSNTAEGGEMPVDNQIDLSIALKKIHELALADGDLGFEYWHHVGNLLKRANGMQAEIDSLSKELERCRTMLRKSE